MIPILFSRNDTDYDKNGVGFLTDATACDVTEERNGAFECALTYPITGQHYADIAEGAVIKIKPNDTSNPQLFRIYSHSKPINGIVTFAAEHISYDLNGIPLASLSLRSTTAQSAIAAAISAGAFDSGYTATSDITTINSIDIKTPRSIRAALGGQEGSVLDVWGGEFEFDNKQIKLHAHRGSDTGVSIVYGKNLTDVRQERNITETYTHIMPYATYTEETEEGDETTQTDIIVTLTEKVLAISGAENVGHQKALVLDLSEMFAGDETITETALRAKANQYISAHPALGTPKISITASFVALWQTEEYKDIAPLERVRLCDSVTIKFDKLGISAKAKVVKTVYDALAERYKSVELGEARSNFADTVLAQNEAITDLTKVVRKGFSVATQQMQKAIAEATAAITGNSGGYVVLYPEEHPQEILILDAPTLDEAVHVWRWNSSGLGYSSTGYNGTYGLAMTMNGAIVADYITAGNLNGALITAGTVSSNAISAGFKNEIATSINTAKETVEQEFKVADEALMSRIATSTSKYDTTGKTIDFYGYGLSDDQVKTDTGVDATEHTDAYFLNQTDGKLYKSNGTKWIVQETLPLLTEEIITSITQTANEISLKVASSSANFSKNLICPSKHTSRSSDIENLVIDDSAGAISFDITGGMLYSITWTGSSLGLILGHTYILSVSNLKVSDGLIEYRNSTSGVVIKELRLNQVRDMELEFAYTIEGYFLLKLYNTPYLNSLEISHLMIRDKNVEDSTFTAFVDNGKMLCSAITMSDEQITFNAGRLVYNGGKCTIAADGTLTATSGVFNNCSIVGGSFTVQASSTGTNIIDISGGDTTTIERVFISPHQINVRSGSPPYASGGPETSITASAITMTLTTGALTGTAGITPTGISVSTNASGTVNSTFVYPAFIETKQIKISNATGVAMQAASFLTYGNTLNIGISEMPLRLCGTTIYTTADLNFVTDGKGLIFGGKYAYRMYNNEMALGADTLDMRFYARNVYFNCPAYANTGVIITSDARAKRCIEPIDNRYLDLIRRIAPMRYKLADSNDNVYHTGFIAQDVRKAMFETDIAPDELGAFVDNNGKLALRYEEFIPLVLAYVKYLEGRIGILESKERFYNG